MPIGSPYRLYRYFDARDLLLYIGISGQLGKRNGAHISRSKWMQFTARFAVEPRDSLEEVKDAERLAIEAEHPVFNQQHNNTPEARERLHAYLDEAGRLDLLPPRILAAIELDRLRKQREIARLGRQEAARLERLAADAKRAAKAAAAAGPILGPKWPTGRAGQLARFHASRPDLARLLEGRPCGDCGAAPGEPCHTANGNLANYHQGRRMMDGRRLSTTQRNLLPVASYDA